MTDLERHILRLLLDNDCVIVPGFGGFMAHHIPAKYNEEKNLFSPPMRIVGFNQQLNMNDSLLAHEYVETYDISYPEALKRIAIDVEALKNEIDSCGTYYIVGIGHIVSHDNNAYDFIPDESGITTPSLYGLLPLDLKQLAAGKEAQETKPVGNAMKTGFSISREKQAEIQHNEKSGVSDCENTSDSNDAIAVHIPIRYIKHLAAACVILFILLSIPSKLGNAIKGDYSQSSIDTSILYQIMPKDLTSGKPKDLTGGEKMNASSANHANTPDDGKKEVAAASKSKKISTPKEAERFFTIVLASRVTRSNAESYVEQLHKRGYADAYAYTRNGNTKVIYKKFKNREDARKASHKLSDASEFADCWITEVKE